MKTVQEIDNLLQTYLPDEYYEDQRKKLVPLIERYSEERLKEWKEKEQITIKRAIVRTLSRLESACGRMKICTTDGTWIEIDEYRDKLAEEVFPKQSPPTGSYNADPTFNRLTDYI